MSSVSPRAIVSSEVSEFLRTHPEVQYVDLLISDMNGVVRGKRIERPSLHKVYERGINLPASLFALDINGSTVKAPAWAWTSAIRTGSATRSPAPWPTSPGRSAPPRNC